MTYRVVEFEVVRTYDVEYDDEFQTQEEAVNKKLNEDQDNYNDENITIYDDYPVEE